MRYVKRLGFAAMAVAAFMVFVGAGTASAEGTLCSAAETTCSAANRWAPGTVIDLSQEESLKDTNTAGTETIDTCKESTIKFHVTSNPGGPNTTQFATDEITWKGCTFPTTTTVLGGLKIAAGASGSGTMFSNSEIKWKYNTVLFGTCEYGVKAGAQIGTIKEGKGTAVTLTINANLSRLNACIGPETTKLTGAYILTEPTSTTFYVSDH